MHCVGGVLMQISYGFHTTFFWPTAVSVIDITIATTYGCSGTVCLGIHVAAETYANLLNCFIFY